ncbi:MAG TPA: flagellar hook-basal body complex protein FliE [Hyphomonadaceae bacterium]|jgi:flagellar hook-basal body complex protein FliE|nr:flagellar hook-basal body complex protein FliE [Hyphomonadaceae bacterium]HPN06493.1 flagellar hook-basal body complex protein FliE [Hyphomonadaceae bacterium]
MSDLGLSAVKAYGGVAQTLGNMSGGKEAGGIGGAGFGDILNTAVGSLTGAGNAAETAVTNAAMGRGDLVDVVTAVAAAEATMETVIAVRDEVIKAYQEIMRMPI